MGKHFTRGEVVCFPANKSSPANNCDMNFCQEKHIFALKSALILLWVGGVGLPIIQTPNLLHQITRGTFEKD